MFAPSLPEQPTMGGPLGSEHPRSLPVQLRQLVEAATGPAQERAWTRFIESYSRLILYVARQRPRDDDAVMDRYVFVLDRLRENGYRRLRTFAADGRGKFTTWLIVVVRRLCLDHDRQRYGRAPAAPSGAPSQSRRLVEVIRDPQAMDRLPSEALPADEAMVRDQTRERLHAAVAALSTRDQLLLTLRYEDGRTARDIASLMSLPTVFHVYRRLDRVHRELRRAIAGAPEHQMRGSAAAPVADAVQYDWTRDDPLEQAR